MHSLGARRTNFSVVAPESTLSAIFKHHLKTDLSHRYRIELFSADNSTQRNIYHESKKSQLSGARKNAHEKETERGVGYTDIW